VRSRGASIPPGTDPAGPPAGSAGSGLPARTAGASGRAVGNAQGNSGNGNGNGNYGSSKGNGGDGLPVRSAEQVRNRLSGLQRGARRAAGQVGGQAPQEEETGR